MRRATRVLVLAAALGSIAVSPCALGQTFDLRDLLTSFLRQGVTLAPPTAGGFSHEAHFIANDNPQFAAFNQFNNLVANGLSNFPLASSAGGFTYKLDPNLGVFTRATDSFGPIYTERGETIGLGKFNFGLNYSFFSFDQIDGLDLRDGSVKLLFSHQDTNGDNSSLQPFFEGDLISTQLLLKIKTSITAFVLTYGVSERLDVGVAVPIVDIDMEARANAHIERLATGTTTFSTIHRFLNGTTEDSFSQKGSASGLGDIVLRGKYAVLRSDRAAFAVAADVRVPSGEERDLLGTGSFRFKGNLVGSAHLGTFSPHVNVGFATSTSPSGGGEKAANEVDYSLGFDVAAGPRLTFVADFLGRTALDTNRVRVISREYTANANGSFVPTVPPVIVTGTYQSLTVEKADVSTYSGSVGLKFNPFANLLLTLNGLFSLNKSSLQDQFTPLVGIDYSF